jgi:hypothetical protein
VNTTHDVHPKLFTINRNSCSRSFRIRVHDVSESLFTLLRNTQFAPALNRPGFSGG